MVRLLVTRMEQRKPPGGVPAPAPSAGSTVGRWKPGIGEYLRLYRSVGEAVQWEEHLRSPREALGAFLQADTTWVFLLCDEERKIGFCEAAEAPERSIRITHFGLVPSAYGEGFGRFLLDGALRALWRERPSCIWLHTDTNDHPAAVRTYARAGFTVSERAWQTFPD